MGNKLLDYECQECIKLYGHSEQRCAFCEEKAYYRDGLIENNIGNNQGADPSGIGDLFVGE